jgi:hypothetical protein
MAIPAAYKCVKMCVCVCVHVMHHQKGVHSSSQATVHAQVWLHVHACMFVCIVCVCTLMFVYSIKHM